MKITLNEITIKDLDTVVMIHCESWRDAYKGFMDEDYISRKNSTRRAKWENILAESPAEKHFLIRDGDIPVGMISMDSPRENGDGDTYEIFGLYILPQFMKKGYGTAAVSLAEAKIRDLGYGKISLWVLEPNQRARSFWEKMGFASDGTEKISYYDKPIKVLRYLKKI